VIGSCKECGARVVVTDGVITRDCQHHDAGVTTELTATCYGESKVTEEKQNPLVALLLALVAILKK
jgi:hypothetical protein